MRRILAAVLVVGFAVFFGCGEAPESSGNQGGGDGEEGLNCFSDLDHQGQNELGDFQRRADRLNEYGIEPECSDGDLGRDGLDCEQLNDAGEYYGGHCVDGTGGGGCYWAVVAGDSPDSCEYRVVCADEDQWGGLESRDDRPWSEVWADGCVW